MLEFLFLDLDDTIFDFHKAEHIALSKTLRSFGMEPTQQVLDRYSIINRAHWEKLERKELTREQVVVGRFKVLFQEKGIQVDPEQVARKYEDFLSQGHYFLPGAEEALVCLSKKYKLYLASNGTAKVQAGRLKSSGIGKYFQFFKHIHRFSPPFQEHMFLIISSLPLRKVDVKVKKFRACQFVTNAVLIYIKFSRLL
ncbi:MAG: HAD hydrolase-like protein, partial [Oscillospiraceae bacterium]|nr:HAD hydrolase-like protein [Oscillospiraceae bacterium]